MRPLLAFAAFFATLACPARAPAQAGQAAAHAETTPGHLVPDAHIQTPTTPASRLHAWKARARASQRERGRCALFVASPTRLQTTQLSSAITGNCSATPGCAFYNAGDREVRFINNRFQNCTFNDVE